MLLLLNYFVSSGIRNRRSISDAGLLQGDAPVQRRPFWPHVVWRHSSPTLSAMTISLLASIEPVPLRRGVAAAWRRRTVRCDLAGDFLPIDSEPGLIPAPLPQLVSFGSGPGRRSSTCMPERRSDRRRALSLTAGKPDHCQPHLEPFDPAWRIPCVASVSRQATSPGSLPTPAFPQ